jgi:site-specific DNA recombinase
MTKKQLRFAPLIRVSTERQEKQGESLNVQKKRIIEYVKSIGGVIPHNCWKYFGQEHATPSYEKEIFNQLLKDSSKDLFDAVIVYDASRWSRDNLQSKKGLNILRENNIEFYVGATKYDLNKSEARLFLGMSTEMNEFFAGIQKEKSIESKIERLRAGIPASGNMPWGRTYSKGSGWSIDKDKQRDIESAAKRYLKGESRREIAKCIDMSEYNLWKILTKRSGNTWIVKIKRNDSEIIEIPLKVPRLLPQEMIDAIHKKAELNKTYKNKVSDYFKKTYLLSGMILCDTCGYALCGYSKPNDKRYYRHADKKYRDKCTFKKHISADDIEKGVLAHLFKMYGNISEIKKSIKAGIPNNNELEELRKEKKALEKKLGTSKQRRGKYQEMFADGNMTKTELEQKLQSLDEKIISFDKRIDAINSQFSNSVNIKNVSEDFFKQIIKRIYKSKAEFKNMSFKEKRELLLYNFYGKYFDERDNKKRRCGVYITDFEEKDGTRHFTYSIRGVLNTMDGTLPYDKYSCEDMCIENDLYDSFDPYAEADKPKKTKKKHKRTLKTKDTLNIHSTNQHYFRRKHH